MSFRQINRCDVFKTSQPRDFVSRLLGRGCCLAFLVVIGTAAMGGACVAAEESEEFADTEREYAVKATYLYQFSRYVEWPTTAFVNDESPLVIGILGKDPFGGGLDELVRDKRVAGRPVVVRRFATMEEYRPCQILFVTASVNKADKTAALRQARKHAILLVGEERGFAEQGGTVNFFTEGDRIRFEINVEVASKDQLRISSRLLALARIVGRQ